MSDSVLTCLAWQKLNPHTDFMSFCLPLPFHLWLLPSLLFLSFVFPSYKEFLLV